MKRFLLSTTALILLLFVFHTGCGKVDGLVPPDYSIAPPTVTPTPEPPCTYPNGWFFDSNITGWEIGWTSSTSPSCGATGSSCFPVAISYYATEGSPNPGSMRVTLGFSSVDQKADVDLNVATTNLSSKLICTRLKLVSGGGSGVKAKIYLKTSYAGYNWIWGNGPEFTLSSGQWISATMNPASPDGSSGGYDSRGVVQVGMEFISLDSVPAVVLMDTWSYN